VDPIGVVGLLLDSSFFLANIVALLSHCDSVPSPPSAGPSNVISGKSVGTLADVTSLLLKCSRWDNLFFSPLGDFDLESLFRDETDAPDTADELRCLPLNKRLVLDSVFPSTDGGGDASEEEKVGGEIISWVLVSLR
jgi:hypothetical protein